MLVSTNRPLKLWAVFRGDKPVIETLDDTRRGAILKLGLPWDRARKQGLSVHKVTATITTDNSEVEDE